MEFRIGFDITLVIILILFILLIISWRKNRKLKEENIEKQKQWLRMKNVTDMVSFHIRAYKEGKNAFTVLRDILEIMRDYL